MTRRYIIAIALLLLVACKTNRPAAEDARVSAARAFTDRYAHSRLSKWDVRARAAGGDCAVLLIHTSIVLEDSMIEAMHYGSGPYDIYDGGVNRFYRERSFRGTAYRDSTGRVWTFGAVTNQEAESLPACH